MIRLLRNHAMSRVMFCLALSIFNVSWLKSAETGFVVQPMIVDIDLQAGRVSKDFSIRLDNEARVPQHVSLRLVELLQDKDGQFRVVGPNQQNLMSGLQQSSSCLKWLSFETGAQHDVQIGARERSAIEVKANVPPETQGCYCAGVVVKLFLEPSNVNPVPTSYEYVIPVLFRSWRRPGTERLQIKAIDIKAPPEGGAGKGRVCVEVENSGNALSPLLGSIKVLWTDGYEKRTILDRTPLNSMKLLPGSTVELVTPLPGSLAPGYCKIVGIIQMLSGKRMVFARVVELNEDLQVVLQNGASKIDSRLALRVYDPPTPQKEAKKQTASKNVRLHDFCSGTVYDLPFPRSHPFPLDVGYYAWLSRMAYMAPNEPKDKCENDPHRTSFGRWRLKALCNHRMHLGISVPSSPQESGAWDCRIDPDCLDGMGRKGNDVLVEIQRFHDDNAERPERAKMEMPAEIVLQITPDVNYR